FLQDWRTTLIPTLTIPVSLVGTFAVISVFGFSINTLTLFGLVLAIGIVVDDAIVVVENTQRHLDEEGLLPREATRRATAEVVGPVIATALVLMAVFIPIAFLPGITGQLYRQFALTIAVSVALSALNALTLTPSFVRSRRCCSTHPASRPWSPSAGAASSPASTARTSPPSFRGSRPGRSASRPSSGPTRSSGACARVSAGSRRRPSWSFLRRP